MNSKLLFLLLFLLPTQLGKHFFLPFSYLSGVRIDYLAPTVYLTDVLIFFLIIFNFKTVINFFRNKTLLIFLFLLTINTVFSLSPYVSMIRIIKWLEWFSLFAIVKKNFSIYQKQWFWPVFIGSLFQLILVILQLIYKHSIQGIFYFFGERYFTLSTPGVAKAVLQGTEFLRPYGTFSHPNSLAGFYLLIYFFVLTNKTLKNIFLKYSLLFVCIILVFLSFSKIAIITLILLSIGYYLPAHGFKKCKVCFLAKIVVPVVVGLIFVSAQTDPLSLQKRLTLITDAWRIYADHPIFGVGLGSYLVAQNQFPIKYSYFFLQPVHNIFLLFLTETGIIISLVVGWLIVNWLKNKKFFFTSASLLLVSIFITGSFDHYWLTLQQNFLLLAVVFTSIKFRG